jgi:membrane associated rhomboid family serine protease
MTPATIGVSEDIVCSDMFPLRDTIPRRQAPIMTSSLIAVNVAVFLYELNLDAAELERFVHLVGIVPARYTHTPSGRGRSDSPSTTTGRS